jgi:hypothetical protein
MVGGRRHDQFGRYGYDGALKEHEEEDSGVVEVSQECGDPVHDDVRNVV